MPLLITGERSWLNSPSHNSHVSLSPPTTHIVTNTSSGEEVGYTASSGLHMNLPTHSKANTSTKL